MNFYFAPIIPGLEAWITLSNYAPVENDLPHEELYIYTAWTDGQKWNVRVLDKLKPDESKSLAANNNPVGQSSDGIVIYFLFPEDLPDVLNTLPVRPDLMRTIPEWRGNIQLRSSTTSVSYQGDYPDSMLNIPAGSLVSIGPMNQASESVSTKLIFTNIRKDPAIQVGTVVVKGLQSGRILGEYEVKTNQCNVLDITKEITSVEESTGLLSPDTAGVPVYLSHDRDFRFLSLEHTHPPIALTMFGNTKERMEMVRNMKQYWLKSLSNT